MKKENFKMELEINFKQLVKDEVDKYLKEAGFPVKKEEKVGFEDDEIFLLSKQEYEKYRDVIPRINCWWWLRSAGGNDVLTSGVFSTISGNVDFRGTFTIYPDRAVRPALKFLAVYNENGVAKIGDRIIVYDFPWIVIDKNLAIAEVPVAFDKFDDKSNDYKNSYIRKFLKEWVDKRR